MRAQLLRFNGAVECDAAIDAWMREHGGELGAITHELFEVMRKCGDEVLEIVHDGCPVACLITQYGKRDTRKEHVGGISFCRVFVKTVPRAVSVESGVPRLLAFRAP
jgi:hypothetical protein